MSSKSDADDRFIWAVDMVQEVVKVQLWDNEIAEEVRLTLQWRTVSADNLTRMAEEIGVFLWSSKLYLCTQTYMEFLEVNQATRKN